MEVVTNIDIVTQFSYAALILVTIVVAFIDIKKRIIPNTATMLLITIWVFTTVAKWVLSSNHLIDLSTNVLVMTCAQQIIACVSVLALLTLSVFIVGFIRKKRNKPEQTVCGMGDIKYLAVVCLYFGYKGSFACVLAACISLLIYAAVMHFGKRQTGDTYPFAPFILIGVLFAVMFSFVPI